jgi:hypothetical protein
MGKHECQSIGHIANLVTHHQSCPAPRAILPVDMRIPRCTLPVLLLLACLGGPSLSAQPGAAPHLEKRGSATQLIVDGKPFLILGGELHNSSSSSLA